MKQPEPLAPDPIQAQRARAARRLGAFLAVMGVLLTLLGSAILVLLLPQILHPGVDVNGSGFIRTPAQAGSLLIALGGIAALGLSAAIGGAQMWRHGRWSKALFVTMGVLFVAVWTAMMNFNFGAR